MSERPLYLFIHVDNIEKQEIDSIIKSVSHLDSKPYIKEGMLKLTFPIKTALSLTLQDFIVIIGKSTQRLVYAYFNEDDVICFKLSNKKYDLSNLKTPSKKKQEQKKVEEKTDDK